MHEMNKMNPNKECRRLLKKWHQNIVQMDSHTFDMDGKTY